MQNLKKWRNTTINPKKRREVSEIKLYVISVICITVVGCLVSMLSPEGEGGGIFRNIKLIYGICMVFVCMYPIKNIIIAVKELDIGSIVEIPSQSDEEYKDILDSSYSSAEIANLKNGIKQILYDRFDIDGSECKIDVSLSQTSNGDKKLQRVLVTLYGTAIWKDTGEIESTLEDILSCEIVTAIG